jgi:hypothetical protein
MQINMKERENKKKKKQTRAKPDEITMHTSFREVGPAWMNQKILRKTIFFIIVSCHMRRLMTVRWFTRSNNFLKLLLIIIKIPNYP